MYIYIYIYIYREREREREREYVYMEQAPIRTELGLRSSVGTGLMGTELNGCLVRKGNIPFRTSRFKHILRRPSRFRHILKWPARKGLGTRRAQDPFSRCRYRSGDAGWTQIGNEGRDPNMPEHMCHIPSPSEIDLPYHIPHIMYSPFLLSLCTICHILSPPVALLGCCRRRRGDISMTWPKA